MDFGGTKLGAAVQAIWPARFVNPDEEAQFEQQYLASGRPSRIFGFGLFLVLAVPCPLYAPWLLHLQLEDLLHTALILSWLAFIISSALCLVANIRITAKARLDSLILGGNLLALVFVLALRQCAAEAGAYVPLSVAAILVTGVGFLASLSHRPTLLFFAIAASMGVVSELSLPVDLGLSGPELFIFLNICLITCFGALAAEVKARAAWRAHDRLNTLATIDSLTQLPNRARFRATVKSAMAQAARDRRSVALAFLDVDRFKQINDEHGHHFGDEVLTMLGRTITQHARRPLDLAGRFGGDEFVMFLYGLSEQDAVRNLENLLEHFRHAPNSKPAVQLTVSAGLLWIADPQQQLFDDYARAADSLLYEAKGAGRDRVFSAAYNSKQLEMKLS